MQLQYKINLCTKLPLAQISWYKNENDGVWNVEVDN